MDAVDNAFDILCRVVTLKEERIALEADIRLLGRMGKNICPICAHYNHGAGDPKHCPKALKEDCFEWRGMKEG